MSDDKPVDPNENTTPDLKVAPIPTLFTGEPAVLGSYLKLAEAVFGRDSTPVQFLRSEIRNAPNGESEVVVQSEPQMVALLGRMFTGEVDVQEAIKARKDKGGDFHFGLILWDQLANMIQDNFPEKFNEALKPHLDTLKEGGRTTVAVSMTAYHTDDEGNTTPLFDLLVPMDVGAEIWAIR